MRILALLWTVCLVKLCYSGSDLQPQNSPEATGQESTEAVKPLSPFLTKVDGSLFDVEEAEEYAVKVLKLTVKNGGTTKKVRYDGKDIWSARAVVGSPCSSAVLYMDGEKPTLAVIRTKGFFGGESTIYKYYENGSKWKNGNEGTHKSKLVELKEKYKHAKPATLDLSNPDTSKLDVHMENESEVSFKGYSPKDAFHISSVVDSGATVWEAEGANDKCLLADSYAKGDITILCLETSDSNGTKFNYFEKTDRLWKSLKEKEFNEKAKTVMGESGKDISLDISHTNRILCKSFDYTFAGNAIRLIVPNKDTTATKLVNGAEEDAYTLPSGETLDHAKAYLNKDKKPELVLLVFNTPSGISRRDYVKSDNGWTVCNNSDIKMRSLRDPAEWISNFELDLSASSDTDQCTVFEVDLLGVTTRHFYPKPGHVSTKVKDGGKRLWTAGYYDACLSCLVYKHGTEEILEMTVTENNSRRWKHFERNGEEWKSIEKTEFDQKLNEMRKSVSLATPPQATK